MWPDLTTYWPIALVAAGAVLLAYGQRGRLLRAGEWFFWPFFRPEPKPAEMTLTERLELYARLRGWLFDAGRIKATDALDQVVLPELVHEDPP